VDDYPLQAGEFANEVATNYIYHVLGVNAPHATVISEALVQQLVKASVTKEPADNLKQLNAVLKYAMITDAIEGKSLGGHYQPDPEHLNNKGPYPTSPTPETNTKNWEYLGGMFTADILVLNADRFGLIKSGEVGKGEDNVGNIYVSTPGVFFAIDNSSNFSRDLVSEVDSQMNKTKGLIAKYFKYDKKLKKNDSGLSRTLCTDLNDHIVITSGNNGSHPYNPDAAHIDSCVTGVTNVLNILSAEKGAFSKKGIPVLSDLFITKTNFNNDQKIKDHYRDFFKNYVMCNRMRMAKAGEKSSSGWCKDSNTKTAAKVTKKK